MKSSQSRRYKQQHRKNDNTGLKVLLILLAIIGLGYWAINAVTVNVAVDSVVTVEVGESYRQEISATWLGIDITDLGKFEGEVDTSKVGSYYLTYKAPFLGKEYKTVVNVKDSSVPKITLLGDTEVFVSMDSDYEEDGYHAYDSYDGDITYKVERQYEEINSSTYRIKYVVKDSSGNESYATRMVIKRKGVVCLTFDDGPSVDSTPQILEILDRNNVKATFFVVGFGEKKYDLVKQMVEDGHQIGYHGYTHEYSKLYQSVDSVMENFYKVEKLVTDVTWIDSTKIVRFPGGSSNTVSKKYCKGVVTEAAERLLEEGYQYFDWNVDSQDAGGAKNSEEVYQNVISGIKPGRTNIVLMHDSTGNQKTVDALQRIIDYCFENGYEFRIITKDTTAVHHNIAN